MTNEKFVYLHNLLTALNGWFNPPQGYETNTPLSPHAILLDSDETVREAVAKALRMLENPNS